jgi:hypothetical protein
MLITFNYLETFHCFKLFQFTLFMAIYDYSQLIMFISSYFTLCYFQSF